MLSLKVFKPIAARVSLIAVLLLSLMVSLSSPAAAASGNANGAVFTLTNAAAGNEVLMYNRSSDGSLAFAGAYDTGGLGSGAGLGSQTALVLTENNRWLYAVNAGSNEISAFTVRRDGLKLVDVVDSGGEMPVSLTVHKDLLYVLNAGGSGNISGFSIGKRGSLTLLAGSTQPVSNGGIGTAPGPAQVAFNSDGSALVVTEKDTNLLDTYRVEGGLAGPPVTHPSEGETPFGFAFDRHNHAIVSEAASGSVSSYKIEGDQFEVISSAVANGEAAACWIAISKNGKYAYTTNAASGSISSYRISRNGALELLDATAGLTGAGSTPLDMAFSNNGSFLYTLASGTHNITIFQFNSDGSLSPLGTVDVPAGVAGVAAH